MATSLDYLRPLCSPHDVVLETGNEDISDFNLKLAINEASRFIESFTGRTFEAISYSGSSYLTLRKSNPDDVFGPDKTYFMIPRRILPVISITKLIEDDVELAQNEDFFVGTSSGKVTKASGIWGAIIKLQGSFGYASLDGDNVPVALPGPIRTACKEIAANFTGENRRERTGFDGETVSILNKSVPRSAVDLLAPFRQILV